MVVLEEDIVSPECDEVYYQTPEELKVKHDPEPDVVHDDSNSYEDREDDDDENEEHDHHEEDDDHEDDEEHEDDDDEEHEEDDEKEKECEPQYEEDVPVPNELIPGGNPPQDEIDHHHHHCDITPIEAIRRTKCCPSSVCISKLNGKYYIDHNDLRCYMDACGESNYESALNNIIAAHNEEGLCSDNIGIVMGESDLLKLDPETKLAMESSSVSFEVYE